MTRLPSSGGKAVSGLPARTEFRSGFVSLTGRPNVGKSTFLNTVLGRKVSIVAHRPQTTRNRVLGIKTLPEAQIVFLDTPGLHRPRHGLGASMVRTAVAALRDVDIVLYLVEPRKPRDEDVEALAALAGIDKPVFLLVNKIDAAGKPELLPVIESYRALRLWEEIFPVSALTGEGIGDVLDHVVLRLPPGPRYYPDEMYTDMPERFMAAEAVREKVIRLTDEEVPHSVAVEVTSWREDKGMVSIGATIFVEKAGHKGIIIGKGGAMLKRIGTSARRDLEGLLGVKVFLELWVKVRKGWRSDAAALRELGID